MTISASKTQVLHFGVNRKTVACRLSGVEFKYLGCIVSEHGKFDGEFGLGRINLVDEGGRKFCFMCLGYVQLMVHECQKNLLNATMNVVSGRGGRRGLEWKKEVQNLASDS